MDKIEEKQAKLRKRIAQLQARDLELEHKKNERRRKQRTRELIQVGAILENYCTPDEIKKLKNLSPENKKKFFRIGFRKFLDEMFPDPDPDINVAEGKRDESTEDTISGI